VSAVECPNCGAPRVRAGVQFCDQCGSRIPASLSRLVSESEELRKLLEQHDPLQARANVLESTLRARSQEVEPLRARVLGLEAANKDLKAKTTEHEDLQARVKELEPLKSRVATLEAENEELTTKTVTQSAEYEGLRVRVKEIEPLQSRIAALEGENRELNALKAKADAEGVELEREKVKELESLQVKLVALEAQDRELKAKTTTESAKYESLRTRVKELESLQVKVVALETENRGLKAQVEKHDQKAPTINPVSVGPLSSGTQFLASQVVSRAASHRTLSDRRYYLGAFMIALGLLTMLASMIVGTMNLSGLGLASFLIGLLVVYLRSHPAVPQELMEASMLSSLVNLERVLRQVKPEGKAVYLAVHDRSDVPKVLLPLADNPARSVVLASADEDRYLLTDSEDPHKCGLLLEAPGASLLALMEKEAGVDFFNLGTDDFVDALRSGMVESLEIATEVKGTITDDPAKFRIKDGVLEGMVRSITRSAPNVSSRLGCPICSAAVCGAVKAVKRDITLEEAAHESGYHSLSLRFAGGTTDETS
jgi:hypothetical protein